MIIIQQEDTKTMTNLIEQSMTVTEENTNELTIYPPNFAEWLQTKTKSK